MSTEYLSGMLFKRLKHSGVKLGLSLIIALVVISSPMVMLLNPTLVEASSSPQTTDPTSFSVPSTIVRNGGATGGSDFTTQAALSSVTARPTNNIVTTTSFYDIVFVTATAGAIKTIEVTFPAGTQMPATPLLNEVEGIGPGTASRSGQTIIYTVANAVNVPAGTRIRLEIANINNPVNPSASYTVMVTTKDATNTPIDGPTPSTAYTMKQLGASIIAPGSITNTRIADGAVTTPKIADFAVQQSKLGTFSVTDSKLDNGAVSTSKIEENAVTTPKIAQDAIVPQLTIVTNPVRTLLGPGTSNFNDALCPASHPFPVGGGFEATSGSEAFMHASNSIPLFGGWRVVMYNSHTTNSISFAAQVVCMAPMP